jgi:hypothetical protein
MFFLEQGKNLLALIFSGSLIWHHLVDLMMGND